MIINIRITVTNLIRIENIINSTKEKLLLINNNNDGTEKLRLKKNKFKRLTISNFLLPCNIPSIEIKKIVIIDPIKSKDE